MRPLLLLALVAGTLVADEDKKVVPEVTERCAKLSKDIEALLGPKFKKPVPVHVVSEDFIARFAREMENQLVPKQVREAAQALAVRLKHIPPGYDMAEEQIRLLRTMVAGLYDADKHCYYVVEGKGMPGAATFDVTAAHELGHAYRGVDKGYWKRVKDAMLKDEDYAVAVTCLVEGDAELIGQAVGGAASAGHTAKAMVPAVVTSARRAPDSIAPAMADPRLRAFPLPMREMLITRYLIGQAFAAAVYQKGGWPALDRAFDDPPRSTEQILHPEKYSGPDRDEPVRFQGGDPAAALGEGWRMAYSNTWGEFMVRVHFTEMFGRRRARVIAAGWDGMRYHFCQKQDVPSFVGLISTWDSENDASEFAQAWAEWASRRDGGEKPREVVKQGEERRVTSDAGLVVVRRYGKDVVVLDGVPPDRVAAVTKALRSAERAGMG